MNRLSDTEGWLERVNFLRSLRVSAKLTLAAAVTFILIGYLAYSLNANINSQIEFNAKESLGTNYLMPAYDLIKFMQVHRGTTNAYLNGNEAAKDRALGARSNLDKAFNSAIQALQASGDPLNIQGDIESLSDYWNELKNRAFEGPAPEVFVDHSDMISNTQNVIVKVADSSNLTLDPELDTFYLMEIVSFRLHALTEYMGQLRGAGSGMIASGNYSKDRLIGFAKLEGKVDIDGLENSLNSAYADNPELKNILGNESRQVVEKSRTFFNQVGYLVQNENSNISSSEYFDLGTSAINSIYDFADSVNQELKRLIDIRVSDMKTERNNLLAKTILGVALSLVFIVLSISGVVSPVKRTQSLLQAIGDGKLDNKILINSKDELGEMLKTLESMQKQMKDSIEEQRRISDEALRVKSALDVCDTSVMMADKNLNIIYMNKSVQDMMIEVEEDLVKDLPNFNARKLMGANIDQFHKKPQHQRELLKTLNKAHQARIKISDLTFKLIATPIFNVNNERIGTVIEWQNITAELAAEMEQRMIADANARVKQALDWVTTNAMVADSDFNIVYTNKSLQNMMKEAEHDLKTALPNFDADNLVGKNIDVFHKNPSHQRNLLSSLTGTHKTQIEVGGRVFSLIANPVVNDDGAKIGAVVEWNDRTKEVSIEQEIDNLVDTAARGDLTVRVSEEGKSGFYMNLAQGLNRLIAISDGVVNDTARVLDGMAHGDLTETIEKDYEGSFGKLKRDANATVEKLTEIISQIRESANTVTTGASEIAQGNADLSQRTEEQASSLEETASSMEEMTSAVRQSAENASRANSLAAEAKDKAQTGGEVVDRAVKAMEEINSASKKISDIIGVIDEIAFQTNLLALNAAVEAARAGEQGRGFAVVAGEVRSLAQRSAGAAKEIKDLIRDSVEKVDAGTQLVNESGQTLSDIVTSVEKVSGMVSDISNASQEQTSGIEQVNKAVSQMDEMTQQNAALVEQASAAGEAMADQARSMMKLMQFFTTDAHQVATAAVSESGAHKTPKTTSAEPDHNVIKSPVMGNAQQVSDPEDEWEEF